MRITRKAAYQGHAIPSKAGYSLGPFNPEVLAEPVITFDEGAPEPPYGATAQNGYREVQMYKCRACQAVVREDELDMHTCEAVDGD